MLIVDTTVLAYAVGGDHDLREGAREFLRHVSAREVRATTTPEVIQEFAHVRSRRVPRTEATRQAIDFATLFSPLVVTTDEDVSQGLRLWQREESLGSFDTVLIAVAARLDAVGVVSTDKAFARQKLVPHLSIAQAVALSAGG